MNMNAFQNKCKEFAVYDKNEFGKHHMSRLSYTVLGLCGESGELAEKLKKVIRDNNGVLTEDIKHMMKLELGDVLFYLAMTAHELGIDLEDVAISNIEKLSSRKARGVLKGSGDLR